MHIKTVFLFLLTVQSCTSPDNSMNQFIRCYPDMKYEAIKESINILDLEIMQRYPDKDLLSAYRSFAKNCLQNHETYANIINTSKLAKIHQKLVLNNVWSDLLINNEQHMQVNYSGQYFQCLSKINDNNIKAYLDNLESTGDYSLLLALSTLVNIKTSSLSELEFFILRTDLLVNIVQDQKTN